MAKFTKLDNEALLRHKLNNWDIDTPQEIQEYFNSIVAQVLEVIPCKVPINIFPCGTDKSKSVGKTYSSEYKVNGRVKDITANFIIIDDYFVYECYQAEVLGKWWYNLSGETLIDVICHEIAHCKIWNHGVLHKGLTASYIERVNNHKSLNRL